MWIVVGASAGLGRALAEELAATGRPLLLVARDRRDLEATAADLRIRHGTPVEAVPGDAADPAALAEAVAAAAAGRTVDGLLLPLGAVSDRDFGLLAPEETERLVRVNLLGVVAVVGRLLPAMLERRRGVIVGFGSVAAVRGRSRNVVYAAAKRALESCLDSVRHLAEPHGVCVGYYVLGYLDTNLAWGRPLLLGRADPRRLAERVCRELGRCRGRRYHPRLWAAVSFLLRALPWTVFRRMRF